MKYGYYDTAHPRPLKTDWVSFALGIATVVGLMLWIQPKINKALTPAPMPVITPCPDNGCIVTPTPTPTAAPSRGTQRPTEGVASYYSIAGCLGCSPTFTMANGKRLDDSQKTIAYNHAPLNSTVTIRNTKTGVTVVATITDRGGFERHGKIADLTIATRDALGCGDICPIELVW